MTNLARKISLFLVFAVTSSAYAELGEKMTMQLRQHLSGNDFALMQTALKVFCSLREKQRAAITARDIEDAFGEIRGTAQGRTYPNSWRKERTVVSMAWVTDFPLRKVDLYWVFKEDGSFGDGYVQLEKSNHENIFTEHPFALVGLDSKCSSSHARLWDYNTNDVLSKRVFLHGNGEVSRTVYSKRVVLPLDLIYSNDLPKAELEAARKDRVLVTILDTGVDYNHPALAYKICRTKPFSREAEERFSEIRRTNLQFRTAEQEVAEAEEANRANSSPVNLPPFSAASEMEALRSRMDLLRAQAAVVRRRAQQIEIETLSQGISLREIAIRSREEMLATINASRKETSDRLALAKNRKLEIESILSGQLKQIDTLDSGGGVGVDMESNDEQPYDYSDYLLNIWGNYHHGTHIAAIASQNTDDIAILPIRRPSIVSGEKTDKAFDKAISIAHERGSRIVNVSMGSSFKESWKGLEHAMKRYPDMLFVVAAGNEKSDLSVEPHYPAAFSQPNLMVVSSVDKNGELSSFSNYGPKFVQVAAPGESIVSAWPERETERHSGTSMATAHVTRIAAKMKFINPLLTPELLIDLICQTSEKKAGLVGKVRCGIVNEEAAIQEAKRAEK